MTNRLKNKIALVTGAARGIGAAAAEAMVEEGATVIVTDIRDEMGQALAEQLGPQAHYHHLDVSAPENWERLTQHLLESYGHIDILFNNAGISDLNEDFGPQNPEEASLESWHCATRQTWIACSWAAKWALN